MWRRTFFPALAAGLLAGLLVSLLQSVTTTPLIRAAETYERSAQIAPRAHAHVHAHATGDAHAEQGGPLVLFTVGANIVAGIGYAMLLVGCLGLHGRPADGRRGVLWGLAGFAVFVLAPSLGLPPEAPGSIAADLAARRVWWLFAAGSAAVGLWLVVFARFPLAVLAGVTVALVPHLVGAPQPEEVGGSVPPELAARFAATAIGVGAAFWVMLGWLTGTLYGRLQSSDPVPVIRTIVKE